MVKRSGERKPVMLTVGKHRSCAYLVIIEMIDNVIIVLLRIAHGSMKVCRKVIAPKCRSICTVWWHLDLAAEICVLRDDAFVCSSFISLLFVLRQYDVVDQTTSIENKLCQARCCEVE